MLVFANSADSIVVEPAAGTGAGNHAVTSRGEGRKEERRLGALERRESRNRRTFSLLRIGTLHVSCPRYRDGRPPFFHPVLSGSMDPVGDARDR